MRVKGARFRMVAESSGFALDSSLESAERSYLPLQVDPDDVRTLRRRKATQPGEAQFKRANAASRASQPLLQGVEFCRVNVAIKLEREVQLLARGPTDEVTAIPAQSAIEFVLNGF